MEVQSILKLSNVQQLVETPHFNEYEFTVNIFQRGACFGDSGGPAYQQTSFQIGSRRI